MILGVHSGLIGIALVIIGQIDQLAMIIYVAVSSERFPYPAFPNSLCFNVLRSSRP